MTSGVLYCVVLYCIVVCFVFFFSFQFMLFSELGADLVFLFFVIFFNFWTLALIL